MILWGFLYNILYNQTQYFVTMPLFIIDFNTSIQARKYVLHASNFLFQGSKPQNVIIFAVFCRFLPLWSGVAN